MHHQVFEQKLRSKPFSQRAYLAWKACLALVWVTQRLRHYMLAYQVWLLSRPDPLKYMFDIKSIIKCPDKYSSFRCPYMSVFMCVHTCAYRYVYKGTICDSSSSWENNLWRFLYVVCEFGDVFLYLLPVCAKSRMNFEVCKFS